MLKCNVRINAIVYTENKIFNLHPLMEYTDLINKIFEGNCILFAGSGFSFGAKNLNPIDSKMKGAGTLSQMLLDGIGSNSKVTDLRKASAAYLRKKSADALIKILQVEGRICI